MNSRMFYPVSSQGSSSPMPEPSPLAVALRDVASSMSGTDSHVDAVKDARLVYAQLDQATGVEVP